MPAFRFTGAEPATYWGWTAHAGDVASFPLGPPDDRWELVVEDETAAPDGTEGTEGNEGVQEPELRRPNKAAPAAEWIEFAIADGTFQEKTGQDPAAESTTRKSIVDFYTEPEGTDS